MVHLVARGHSPKKVKRIVKNVGKMIRTKAGVKTKRTVNKNSIIFPAELSSRVSDVNAIFKRHEYVLQNNTVLKELFPTNSLIIENKIIARAGPCNIKTDILDQTDHCCKKYNDSCNNCFLEKTSFACFTTRTKFKIRRDSIVIPKILYNWHSVKVVVNKVLELVSDGNYD